MNKNINLQDVFLNQVRKEHIPVTVYLTNGFQLKTVQNHVFILLPEIFHRHSVHVVKCLVFSCHTPYKCITACADS